MNKVYVGKTVSTHGIKGEIRIISDFQFKDKIFHVGNKIIIDDKEYTIKSYRHHKIYEMVTLDDYKDINEVGFLLHRKVYYDEDKLVLDDNEILDKDLLNYKVSYNEQLYSIIEVFYASATNKIIRVDYNGKEVLIPYNSPMVLKIDKSNKIIYVNLLEVI